MTSSLARIAIAAPIVALFVAAYTVALAVEWALQLVQALSPTERLP